MTDIIFMMLFSMACTSFLPMWVIERSKRHRAEYKVENLESSIELLRSQRARQTAVEASLRSEAMGSYMRGSMATLIELKDAVSAAGGDPDFVRDCARALREMEGKVAELVEVSK